MKRIAVLDYGSGNVRSVYEMISRMQYQVEISNSEKSLTKASHIILPGVGAFAESMKRLKAALPLRVLDNLVHNHKIPFLGICVGMQVLADQGDEFGVTEGLSWIEGKVMRFEGKNVAIPHMGWNQVYPSANSPLFHQFDQQWDVYFVHSYHFLPSDTSVIASTTFHGHEFVSAIQKNNIWGVQFHPEKSQLSGDLILTNFLDSGPC